MSGSELKAGARKLIFENFPRILIISLVYVVLVEIVNALAVNLPGNLNILDITNRLITREATGFSLLYTNFRPAGLVLALLLLSLQPVLDVGFISFCMKTHRKQKTEFKDLLNGFMFFFKIIAIFIVTSFFILLWSLLLIIPGIVASYRYRQAYYILLDDPEKGVFQCIDESKALMNGNKLDLLTVDISFIGWYILDIVIALITPLPFAIPVVSLWLSPYLVLTRVAFYEDRIKKIAV